MSERMESLENHDVEESNHTNNEKGINVDDQQNPTEAIKEDGAKRGPRSWVWQHFKFVRGAVSSECPYCKKTIRCDTRLNGTGALTNHLHHHCLKSPVYKGKRGKLGVNMKNQPVLSFKLGKGGENMGKELTAHSFNQERCRMSLARMCVKDNRPFSIVDDEGYKEHVWELNPMFKIPSRWTVARDCLAIYKDEATNLKKTLKGHMVSLTTDTWSSVQNINYMCLTAHWIDDTWTLRKKILNFCPIANHKGATIGKMVYTCLQKWGIERVFTVTVDNASSNDGAIKYLKTMLKGPDAILECKFIHLRCCAHILNLVVRDGLEEQQESITKIRNAVRYVRSSPAREAKFKECIDRAKIQSQKKVCLDVETRWNSTYLMLETAEKYAEAFERLQTVDYNFKAYFGGGDEEAESTRKRKRKEKVMGPPNDDDWSKARQFIQYLKIFYDVTNMISGSKYVTSNLFFSELVAMHASISKMCLSSNNEERAMATSMKAKYDKYWDNIDNINLLLYVAVVLDPRNKMRYLTFCLRQTYGTDARKTKDITDRVRATLDELFAHYKMKSDKVNGKGSSPSPSSFLSPGVKCDSDIKSNLESSFLKFLEDEGSLTNQSEVETYLSDGMEKRDDNLDILNWWKINALKFPILSQVARHVLAMPISTVASESAFSVGGRVIDPFRSSLTPKMAEALVCAQDWIRSSPTDIELCDVKVKDVEDLQDRLEKLEKDAFASGLKFFTMND